jgi:hypothetical protein
MPDIKNIEAALALCKDESKVLGLNLGTKKITPGQHIPKRGKYFHSYRLSIKGNKVLANVICYQRLNQLPS